MVDVVSARDSSHTTSTFEALSAPEPCCIEIIQIVEALVRRRVSNVTRCEHPLTRPWSHVACPPHPTPLGATWRALLTLLPLEPRGVPSSPDFLGSIWRALTAVLLVPRGRCDHFLDVLLRIFSFRTNAKVRAVAVSLLAWCTRCPRTSRMLFEGRYDERTLKPVHTAAKDYARILEIADDEWLIDPDDTRRYSAETGIALSDGGMHAGVYGMHSSKASRA